MTSFLPRIPIPGVSKTSDLFLTQLFPETHLSNQRFASYERTRDKVTIGHLSQSVCKSCPRCLEVKHHVCVCGYVHVDTSVSLVKQEALLTFSLSTHTDTCQKKVILLYSQEKYHLYLTLGPYSEHSSVKWYPCICFLLLGA